MRFLSFIKLSILQGFVLIFLQARCSPYSFELRVKTSQFTRFYHYKKIQKVAEPSAIHKSKRKFRTKGVKFDSLLIPYAAGLNEITFREILIAFKGEHRRCFFNYFHPKRGPPLA